MDEGDPHSDSRHPHPMMKVCQEVQCHHFHRHNPSHIVSRVPPGQLRKSANEYAPEFPTEIESASGVELLVAPSDAFQSLV